jgi:hypothetical protein
MGVVQTDANAYEFNTRAQIVVAVGTESFPRPLAGRPVAAGAGEIPANSGITVQNEVQAREAHST